MVKLLVGPAWLACGLAVVLCSSSPSAGAAEIMASQVKRMQLAADESAGAVGVIFPDVDEPYRSVFSQILEGIKEEAGASVLSIPISPAATPRDVSEALKGRKVHVVIALGRNGLKMAGSLGHDMTIVGGCVISVPEAEASTQTIFSLAPDPSLLFAKLKSLKPGITRVHVVYDPAQSGWLIQRAKEAAKTNGIELLPHEATDLKVALHVYQDILTDIDSKHDALWLPQDTTTVEESAVLPLLLQEAWNREVVLFSSSTAHVKRGALFSLYPDNKALGRHLGAWASGAAAFAPAGLVPLTDVLTAVNIRTAAHLGLNFSTAQERSFNLVFPED